jgi:putative ABC transport system permease protein
MDTWLQDLRIAIRSARKHPLFFLATIATLALGIGGTVALFDVVRSVLLQPLPYPEPDRLVALTSYYPQLRMQGAISPPDFRDYREQATSFEEISATAPVQMSLTGGSDEGAAAEQVEGLRVSANFFRMLGVEPVQGRSFLADEEQPGRERVVIISHSLWSRRFGSDPRIVNSTIRLNREPHLVAGVMPREFHWGRAYGKDKGADIWTPLAFAPDLLTEENRGNEYLDVYARLKNYTPLETARREMPLIHENLRRQYPKHFPPDSEWRFEVRSLKEDLVAEARPALIALFLAAATVLFLGCCNVAALLLTRMTARRKEILVRAALGATGGRLLRLFLTETVFLALIAGAVSLAISTALLHVARSTVAAHIPRLQEVEPGGATLAFTFLVSLITGLAVGLIPAIRSARHSMRSGLSEESGKATHSASRQRAQKTLMAAQMMLTLVLLAGSGLFLRSFVKILQVHPGFDAGHVFTFRLALPPEVYPPGSMREQFFREVNRRIAAVPGVTTVGMISDLPMSGDNNSGSFRIDGRPTAPEGKEPHAEWWVAGAGYFETMKIPLRSGRLFNARDDEKGAPVVIINDRMARQYWPGEDPLGKRIDMEGSEESPQWLTVVGVVGEVKHRSLEDEGRPQFYVPYGYMTFRRMTIVARSAGRPESLAASIRESVRAVDPDVPVFRVSTMEQWISGSTAQRRAALWLTATFSALALLLAVLGIYGLVSHAAAERTQEIGIRRALGAQPADILQLLMGSTLKITAGAMVGGILLFAAGSRLVSGMLYGVEPVDPGTLVAVTGLLVLTAALSSYIPARRALRIGPSDALRYE